MNLSTKNPDNTWTTGAEYYYVRNAQGDIIGLLDDNGTQVVSYVYASWGKPFITDVETNDSSDIVKDGITGSLAGTVGVKNPYRYRGYRYDTETMLYYLQSRYYNADWGRFINVDALIGETGELLSHNMFAYCQGNPINYSDVTGYNRITALEQSGGGYSVARSIKISLPKVFKAPKISIPQFRNAFSRGSNSVKDGATRAIQYSPNWSNGSLNGVIKKFAPNSKPVLTEKGKMINANSNTGVQVVYDTKGNYFRIENTSRPRGRNYLDLSGNDMNNKIVNGKQMGRSKAEYQTVTHFNNIDK